MDSEPEVIRRQMDETRADLTDKLEQLEQQVAGTVQDAADTVESVRSAVHDSVESVTHSVRHTVDAVSDTLDVSRQVQRHPWPMVLGAAALGFAGGYWFSASPAPRQRRSGERSRGSRQGGSRQAGSQERASNGHAAAPSPKPPQFRDLNGWENGQSVYVAEEMPRQTAAQSPVAAATSPAWVSEAKSALQPAFDQLRGLAVGALFGVVKDLLADSMPKEIGVDVNGVVDQFTQSLGGKPMHGRILPRREQRRAAQRVAEATSRQPPATKASPDHPSEIYDTPCDVEGDSQITLRDAETTY